ncbi:MAG: hypothetical protein JSR19_08000 [Proteobacteria bacterium]|nr:hypothetical protein [Pseudomonadota bacterium]HQR04379.1 hypothetical protein [Rhodocyclaceae bacterium]
MRMHMVALCLAALALAGCGRGDSASYMIGGDRDHSLTIFRDKSWAWSDWQVDVVVTHRPDCMRRHPLQEFSADRGFRLELFQSDPRTFFLKLGKRWYVAETVECRLQRMEQAPADKGATVGAFTAEDEGIVFTPAASTGGEGKPGRTPAEAAGDGG